jgi:hypothetical protein
LGALLSPTGGIAGSGNKEVSGLLYAVGGGKDVVITHGIVHDAAGYLFIYHGIGPGYQYVPGKFRVLSNASPLAGQRDGIVLFYNLKNYGVPVRPYEGGN